MVEVKDEIGPDGEQVIEVPRRVLDDIQEWVSSREFDDDGLTDIKREEKFGKFNVVLEGNVGLRDSVSIDDGDSQVVVHKQDLYKM